MRRPSRRTLLAAVGASLAGLAGCGSAGSDSDSSPTTEPNGRTPTASTPTTRVTTTTTAPTTRTTTPTATRATGTPADLPTTGPPLAGVEAFEEPMADFLRQWEVPGASVAVAKNGRLAFARGYGYADVDAGTPVRPASLFRVGSLSKPVTAVAVLDLVQRGDLSLDDRVFGVLDGYLPDGGPADPRLAETTVRQHLRHTAGWSSTAIGFDPLFEPVRVAEAEGVEPPASAEATVRFLADQSLGSDPGTTFRYSNAGYCVLGRVVEAVAGADYGSHVRERVLEPLGASRMQVGATREAGRLDDEVRYYGHRTVASPFPGEGEVPRPYGAAHLPANDADGGWVGSAVDLLRFVRGIDRRDGVPDVLSAETLSRLAARPDVPAWDGAPQHYGMGWYVIPRDGGAPTLWHNGSLPGSYAFLLHDPADGVTLAALFNSRAPDAQFRTFNARAQRTLLGALREVADWPDRDLFGAFP